MRDIWKGRTRGGDNLECLDSVEGGEVFALYDLAQSFVVDHEMISVLRSSMNDPVAYSVRGGKLTLDDDTLDRRKVDLGRQRIAPQQRLNAVGTPSEKPEFQR